MKAVPDELAIAAILDLKAQQMLFANPEYQRGAVWTPTQKKKLLDSVLRGYPIPIIYFHHITQTAGPLVSQRFEIIDGQQRINALSEYHDGGFKLLDPVKDEAEARFPDFIKKQPCPWAARGFSELSETLKKQFLETALRIVKIETQDSNEARDLFVRLQAGMPLNSQEKRDAWPGQFTDFILRLGGKRGLAKYPGHDFFNVLMKAHKVQDRGKFRQLAAQIGVLFLTRRRTGSFCDINAAAIDDFYYENLDFDANSADARRLFGILDKITLLLRDKKRPKIIGHEAMHLVLLVDTLLDDYTRSWEAQFAAAFDAFRSQLTKAKHTRYDATPNEYWLKYGQGTRANSDRHDVIQRRHEFFAERMRDVLEPMIKDPQRSFGALERELIYYRDRKRCAECGADVIWPEAEIHHVDQHRHGGRTLLENGALVHRHCHPKGDAAEAHFAQKWRLRTEPRLSSPGANESQAEQAGKGGKAKTDTFGLENLPKPVPPEPKGTP
jgi:5-methylcytosine-specific restriction endonuclease McrA